ncbi:phosphatase PAP2 family protein [Streptomyces sp. MUM 203J]|uniref:phosphatase PAP2 family protein n=1 Tax=Streptomyces sp. MUM 203J TaxID=2791990 RepID=UPI001F043F64|nr:phosphatase PAP2 family protein [Streptomyces sp. MUM 203J]MCH0542023.1 phosphatase PAP2 family protein [Streptomyces sp. MUM 203J]
MTEQDSSTLSKLPVTPGQVPGTTAEPSLWRTKRPRVSALLCLTGFLSVYLIAVCTPFGQRAENALFNSHGAKPAWIYDWSGTAYNSPALPPLDDTAMPTLVVGVMVIVAVTLVRRCWLHGCAAAGVVIVTLGGTEALSKVILPRPDLVGAHVSLIEASFPSGHVAIPAGLALGAALVTSPRIRPYITATGMLWLAVTAAAVQATYHHRPSDVLGATLLACACYSFAARLLPSAGAPGATRRPHALPAVALTLSAAGALVAGARDDSVTQSLVFAAAAFLCASLLWYTAAEAPAHTTRRTRPTPG